MHKVLFLKNEKKKIPGGNVLIMVIWHQWRTEKHFVLLSFVYIYTLHIWLCYFFGSSFFSSGLGVGSLN